MKRPFDVGDFVKRTAKVVMGLVAVAAASGAWADEPDYFVEYIQSSGAAYLDTGLCPDPSKTRAVITLAPTSVTSDEKAVFGQRSSGSWAGADATYVLLNSSQFRVDWVANQTKTFQPTVGSIYVFDCRGNVVLINNASYGSSKTKNSGAAAKSFYLCAMNSNGSLKSGLPQKLYGARIYLDGVTLSANYLPCVKNDVAGLYDTVSQTFHPSSSSTAFLAGPQIESSTARVFVGSSDDTWSTAANWVPAGVPSETDDVVIPAGRTVAASGAVSVRSLTIARGGQLFVGCQALGRRSLDLIYPTEGSDSSVSLTTSGDFSLAGYFAIGGRTNEYASVSVAVGGAFTASGIGVAYLYGRYGDTSKAWNNFTWEDFRTGGATFSVAGKTTLSDSAVIYPVAHRKSGLSPIFKLHDLEIGASASINANALGWTYVGGTWYGNGASAAKGGAYGGKGGNNNANTYGYASAPYRPGSPGYHTSFTESAHPGGGAITVFADDVTLNGKLTANGGNSDGDTANYNHGGSGGGVLLCCKTLTTGANAKITADGGWSNKHSSNYGGGGGRVAVITGSPTEAVVDVALFPEFETR